MSYTYAKMYRNLPNGPNKTYPKRGKYAIFMGTPPPPHVKGHNISFVYCLQEKNKNAIDMLLTTKEQTMHLKKSYLQKG